MLIVFKEGKEITIKMESQTKTSVKIPEPDKEVYFIVAEIDGGESYGTSHEYGGVYYFDKKEAEEEAAMQQDGVDFDDPVKFIVVKGKITF